MLNEYERITQQEEFNLSELMVCFFDDVDQLDQNESTLESMDIDQSTESIINEEDDETEDINETLDEEMNEYFDFSPDHDKVINTLKTFLPFLKRLMS